MELLKTRDAKNVYRQISNVIRNHIVTDRAKNEFCLDLTDNAGKIKQMHEKINAYNAIDDDTLDGIREILKDFELKWDKSFFVERIIATEDDEIYEKLFPLRQHCEVVHLRAGDQQKPDEHGKQVIVVDYEPKIVEILPEYILSDFVVNRNSVKKIFEIYELLSKFNEFDDFKIESVIPREILDELFMFNDKVEVDGIGIRQKRENIKNLKGIVYEEADGINSEILKRVDEQAIKIDGKELLEMNVALKDISELAVFRKIIGEVIKEHVKRISENLGVNTSQLSGVFEDCYPSRVNEDEVKFLIDKINEGILEEEYGFKVKLARKLAGKDNFLRDASDKINELDMVLAKIKFCRENNCTIPEMSGTDDAIYFKDAENLFIKSDSDRVVPVTYSLGGELEKRKVSILTGANSGGKTTLLKTILQTQILAQSGMPVNARHCEFPVINEIYFLSKRTGTLNAGAFEHTLKGISKILISDKKKLVLIDELEAITEPGAAARLICAILEMLVEKGDFAVVVTHLSEEILEHIGEDVRVDGITATGLDEQLNLVVDRQPEFNTIGKSTPELIVEKLYRKSGASDMQKEIYKRILNKMGKG